MSTIKKATAHALLTALKRNGIKIGEPFYHATSLTNGLKILNQGFRAKAGGPGNDAYYDNAVCFTRNFDYTQRNIFGGSQIIFILDRNELKQRFKIYPYNWFFLNDRVSAFDTSITTEEQLIFNKWIKGAPKKELLKMLDTLRNEGGNLTLNLDTLIKKFRGIENLAKQKKGWEYEERVSTSNPFTDSTKETYISYKYIKAILIKNMSVSEELFNNIRDLTIPIFFYNYKTKHYQPLWGIQDLNKIDLANMGEDELKERAANSKDVAFLWKIYREAGEGVYLENLALNRNAPDELLQAIVYKKDVSDPTILNILKNTTTSSEILSYIWDRIKEKTDQPLLKQVFHLVKHPNINPKITGEIAEIYGGKNLNISIELINNPHTPKALKAELEIKYLDIDKFLRYINNQLVINRILDQTDNLKFIKDLLETEDFAYREKINSSVKRISIKGDMGKNTEIFKLLLNYTDSYSYIPLYLFRNKSISLDQFKYLFEKFINNLVEPYNFYHNNEHDAIKEVATDTETTPEKLTFLAKNVVDSELWEYIKDNPNTPSDAKAYLQGLLDDLAKKREERNKKTSSRNILYHYTKLSGLKSILATDTLKATQIEGDKYLGVSLTRDPRLSFHEEGGPVRIILDGNKLNQRYKIKPFSFYGGRSNEVDSDNQTYSEEVLLGDIKNLGRYILGVNLETENKAALQALEKYKDKYGLSFKVSYGFDSFRYNPSSTTKVKDYISDRDNLKYEKSKDLFNKEYAKFKRLYSSGALSEGEVLDKIEYLSFDKAFSYYWNRHDLVKFQELWEKKLESPGSKVKKSYVSKDLSMLYNYLNDIDIVDLATDVFNHYGEWWVKYLNESKPKTVLNILKSYPDIKKEILDGETWGDLKDINNRRILIEHYLPSYLEPADLGDDVCTLFIRYMKNNLPRLSNKLPSAFFFRDAEIRTNDWLVHFTKNPEGIRSEGFKWGPSDYKYLGLTSSRPLKSKLGGYNFSYTPYQVSPDMEYWAAFKKMGGFVIFRASGITVYHETDKEYQVIFKGKEARNVIAVKLIDNTWNILSKEGKPIYKNEDPRKLIRWAITNYSQYRKAL